jgi:glutamyl-tRNA synthetase
MITDFEQFKEHLSKESTLKGKAFFKPLRLLLTGAEHGPELADIYPYIKSYILEIAS